MKINIKMDTSIAFVGPSRPEFIFNHPPGGAVEVSYIPTFPGMNRIKLTNNQTLTSTISRTI